MKVAQRLAGFVRREWYAVILAADLKQKPASVEILGEPFVVYRDPSGRPVAHLDRCPHRNVPLSKGQCLADGTLECPYHGWRFAPDGKCVSIPGSKNSPKASHRVETFETCEQYDLIWVCPDEEGRRPLSDPLPLREWSDDGYTTIVRQVEFPGGMHAVVENALDVPHTSVLHRGLFRGGERQPVDVVMRRYRTWAEAEFIGEAPPQGLVARLLSLGSKKGGALVVEHWDRFLLPGVLQVEYKLGNSHFLITGFCTPRGEHHTTLFAVVAIKTPLFGLLERLLVRLIEPFALRVVAQDCEVLTAQSATIDRFGGERFMSTEIDILGAAITRLLKEAVERATAPEGASAASPIGEDEEPREITRLKIDA